MAINIRQALAILDAGNWCQLRFITANLSKGTGGKILDLAKCRIARNRSSIPASQFIKQPKQREANHNINFTRNVELKNKMIVTIHPILITHINNEPVL